MTARYRLNSILLCAALLSACAPVSPGGDTHVTTASTSTTGSSLSGSATGAPGSATSESMGDSASTAPTPTTGPGPGSSTGAGCQFLVCDDMPGEPDQCDQWTQDCPEGQKCAAYIPEGWSSWGGWKCVEVIGTDEPGEPCTMEDVASGVDSCVKGAMCWDVDMGNGHCLALCTGGPEAPTCEDDAICTISADAALILCIPGCDPLLQDCFMGQACYPINDTFACAPDASGDEGQAGDPCEFINVCESGLMCAEAALFGAGCPEGSTGCCTPFCEFPGGACPNPDQQCVQYFDPMQLPPDDPELEIGYCGVPG